MRTKVVGIMGGADAPQNVVRMAFEAGKLIAEQGWVLLNGGRNCGVMDASAHGAKTAGGTTIGILPDADDGQASPYVDYAILTGMRDARNLINVLSCDVIIACPGRGGTLSEVALALKNDKPVITLGWQAGPEFVMYRSAGLLCSADSPAQAIALARQSIQRMK